jgi:hypothetical protein
LSCVPDAQTRLGHVSTRRGGVITDKHQITLPTFGAIRTHEEPARWRATGEVEPIERYQVEVNKRRSKMAQRSCGPTSLANALYAWDIFILVQ